MSDNNNIKMILNEELNGVELYFTNKPDQQIIKTLKESRFRWSNNKKCWYAKQSDNTLKLAESIANSQELPTGTRDTTTTVNNKKQNKNTSLWELTRWTDIEVNNKQATKEIAAEVRKYVRQRFPFVKFSITSTYSSINFYIISSPFPKDSVYLKAIEEYCTNLLKAYNYCTCYDPYGDYGSSYNFYGSYAKIDYQYIENVQTEIIKEMITDFDIKQAEFDKQEEERKEIEYQEHKKQQEEDHKEYLKQQEESVRQVEIINNNIEVKILEESEQYFIINSQFAHLNKNQTLDQYREEVSNGDYYLNNVKITKELHFPDKEVLTYFSNHLLTDFDFLENTGGSYTDDQRINSMIDYEQMTKEEQNTVTFNLYGVAVYYDNELQFIIDTQGYSYSRYVGLIDDNTTIQKTIIADPIYIEEQLEELKYKAETLEDFSMEAITCDPNIIKTWNTEDFPEYKARMKQIFNKNCFKLSKEIIQQISRSELQELKIAMYKLLKEVDSIQDQFKNANLQQGQKYTLFYISDWGSMIDQKITFDSYENTTYAQYDHAVKITFKPQNKKKLYYTHFYGDKQLLIYPGWIDLPVEVLHTVKQTGTGVTITSGKYLSCDKQQYDEVINHLSTQGITPVINTYKPIF